MIPTALYRSFIEEIYMKRFMHLFAFILVFIIVPLCSHRKTIYLINLLLLEVNNIFLCNIYIYIYYIYTNCQYGKFNQSCKLSFKQLILADTFNIMKICK